ncbi:hypothetical protein HK100_008783 [Physocladia obscura]|uniref:Uncharacterized protein n=1 Tax=Physocladia obscura TaxID=109957 RepID=A0AAD5T5K6_9FUNG|nr:hypothetical protein HK100_008783 [Physocladia obscura]
MNQQDSYDNTRERVEFLSDENGNQVKVHLVVEDAASFDLVNYSFKKFETDSCEDQPTLLMLRSRNLESTASNASSALELNAERNNASTATNESILQSSYSAAPSSSEPKKPLVSAMKGKSAAKHGGVGFIAQTEQIESKSPEIFHGEGFVKIDEIETNSNRVLEDSKSALARKSSINFGVAESDLPYVPLAYYSVAGHKIISTAEVVNPEISDKPLVSAMHDGSNQFSAKPSIVKRKASFSAAVINTLRKKSEGVIRKENEDNDSNDDGHKSSSTAASAVSLPSVFNKGRSVRSSQSSHSDDETLMVLIQSYFIAWQRSILESDQYRIYRSVKDNAKYQILFFGFMQLLLFGSILLITQYVFTIQLSAIRFYNLVHAVMSFQGKLILLMGWHLVYLVKKGFAAKQMLSSKQGVPLNEIGDVDPEGCRNVNKLFLICLLILECTLWTLSYTMNWTPIYTYIGDYPCIQLTYKNKWNFTKDLSIYAAADEEFGILDSVGLPMATGIIGGFTSKPNAAPATQFQMQGDGIVYLIDTVCQVPTLALDENSASNTTTFSIISDEYWGQLYNAGIKLVYPAGTHSFVKYLNNSIQTLCQLQLLTGLAQVSYAYTSDEWGGIIPNAITEILINNSLSITPGTSVQLDFGQVHHLLGNTELVYENITYWIAQAIAIGLNGTDLQAVTATDVTATILAWGVGLDSLYDADLTWQGVSVAVAFLAHYVLNQADFKDVTICKYKGIAGYGTISAPSWVTFLLLVILVLSMVMELVVILSWMVVVGGGKHLDKAVAMIDNPLRTVYYMRGSLGKLVTKIDGNDLGQISLEQQYKKVRVRLGEDKTTRDNEVGTIILDEPTKVVKISKSRKVA